jgi:hypothetical protein
MADGGLATGRGRKRSHGLTSIGLTSILFAKGKPRSALLTGASTIAFAALGCPGAKAACVPSLQTISILNYPGPIISNGGDITVNSGASVVGGPTGVYASSCGIGALSNSGEISGLSPAAAPTVGGIGLLVNLGQTIGSLTNLYDARIQGGSGGRGTALNASGVAGGAGVSNAGTITSLTNGGLIVGGTGGSGTHAGAGAGGTGVSNAGTITSLTNTGIINGNDGSQAAGVVAGAGGAGVFNAGTITTLTNTGIIAGGGGGIGDVDVAKIVGSTGGGAGGAGVSNAANETIVSLSNDTAGMIKGGPGGSGANAPGGAGGAGVSNSGAIGALTNSGAISGGKGGDNEGFARYGHGGAGGAGVSNAGLIFGLTNSGAISGGNGGNGGSAGAGVSNYGAILTLTNSGMIGGGSGVGGGSGGAGLSNASGANIALLDNRATGTISGGDSGYAGAGGAGVFNAGTITTLTNLGKIGGGNGGANDILTGGAGGAGVSNNGTITTLTNSRTIEGGVAGPATAGGVGGAGVSNAGTITTLTNSGAISGGNGGSGRFSAGAGGAGVSNTGAIAAVINSGVIAGGPPRIGGAAGDAIMSAGPSASIGAITNSGQIVGNVEIDNQPSVTIYGGTGGAYGSWTGGTITVGYRLTFAGGNTALGDSVTFNGRAGGTGTVFNNGPLMVATPITINGGFDQRSGGELDFLLSGDTAGQYGTLDVTGSTILDGVVVVDLASGFHLAGGETFNLLTSDGALTGALDGVSIDGYGCSTTATSDLWLCNGAGLYLDLTIANGLVELTTGAPIPEPSIWAMLAAGFLGLGGLARRRRKTPLAAWCGIATAASSGAISGQRPRSRATDACSEVR